MAEGLPAKKEPSDRSRFHWLRHIPVVAEWTETIMSLLEQFGLKQWVVGSVTAGIFGLVLRFWALVPWYVYVPLSVFFAYHLAGLIHRIQLVRNAPLYDRHRYHDLGAVLVKLSQEVSAFLTDQV